MSECKFYPIINCGLLAGDTPECWDGEFFNSETSCEEWIEHQLEEGNFTMQEIAGGVYPCPIVSYKY